MFAKNGVDREWWSSYYFGQWKYDRKVNVIFKLILYILIAGFPACIFIILIPHFVTNFYGTYFSSILGMILTAIALVYLVPLVARKNKIIFKKHPE